jgi:PAS domain-containing protein
MSEEFPEPTDLRAICSALEHFSLPAALCSIEDNRLVICNQLFQKASGLSEDELAQTGLSSLILLDETYSGLVLESDHPERVVRFVPCVLKNPRLNKWMPGRALRRSDGMLLALLGLPVGDVAFEGFIHGHFIGREQERERL